MRFFHHGAASRLAVRGWFPAVGLAGLLGIGACAPDPLASAPAAAASPLEEVYDRAQRQRIPADATVVGSGFFIAPGTILTSAHVLAGCGAVLVESRELGRRPAERGPLLARNDAAFLTISAVSPDVLAVADEPAAGPLWVVGFPARESGSALPLRFAVAHYEFTGNGLLMLNAEVPAGVSGGPVVDSAGRVVGLLTGRMGSASRRAVVASPVVAFRSSIERLQGTIGAAIGYGNSAAERATVKVLCK